MKALEEKIIKEGKILPGDVLKIDNFLNHQIDTKFTIEMAQEFRRLFGNINANKILTVEASGIAIACAVANCYDYIPVVFAKKVAASNMDNNKYSAKCHSYTRQKDYTITVAREYLNENDNVLIIDDFLATGQACLAMLDICQQAGCNVVGIGCVVEKVYQEGGAKIKEKGIHLETLAKVTTMYDDGRIEFMD